MPINRTVIYYLHFHIFILCIQKIGFGVYGFQENASIFKVSQHCIFFLISEVFRVCSYSEQIQLTAGKIRERTHYCRCKNMKSVSFFVVIFNSIQLLKHIILEGFPIFRTAWCVHNTRYTLNTSTVNRK